MKLEKTIAKEIIDELKIKAKVEHIHRELPNIPIAEIHSLVIKNKLKEEKNE